MPRKGRVCTHHGEVGTPLHSSWISARKRCYSPSHDSYPYYGGRGITMHPDWADYTVFASDIRQSIGDHPGKGFQLDRIDTEKNYEPGNVRWATPKKNARNRRSNTLLTFDGKTQCVSAWAEEKGWGRHVILTRLKLGWSVEEVLSTPLNADPGGWVRRRKRKAG